MLLELYFDEEIPELERDMESLLNLVSIGARKVLNIQEEDRINVIVSSEGLIKQLNAQYRGKDAGTDVLSFPLGKGEEVTGEIYICWSKVLSQADDYGHSWQREFAYLLVHGLLHLMGYEHGEESNPEMREMEEKILDTVQLRR